MTSQQGRQLAMMQQWGAGMDDSGPLSRQKSPASGEGPVEEKYKLVWADKALAMSSTNRGP